MEGEGGGETVGVREFVLGMEFGGVPGLALTGTLAGICLVTFWIAEGRSASPLIDPALLRMRSFSLGLVAGLLSYAVQGPAEEVLFRGWLLPVIGRATAP